METTTLTISLPKEVSAVLEDRAKTSGKGVAEYVQDLVANQLMRPTFRELFANVRENITLSDEDLEREIDNAITEARQARREKRG